ncbi:MAG: kelch repeat-containing protein [Gemmatimonadota bacterium]
MFTSTALKITGLAALTLFARPAPTSTPSPDSVQRVATLGMARSVHTATALLSGEVVVIGGMANDGGSLASAELFDPARNTLRAVGRLAVPRASHTATRLRDGRVLVAGGYNGDYLSSVEVFDPATNRFRSAGSLLLGRSGQTATLLADGTVLFVGGVGQGWTFLKSAEVFDPATGTSRLVGALAVPRESHTATLLPSGDVLIVGGHSGRREAMEVYASAELYSPRTGQFSPVGSLATARHKHDAVALADGRVLVLGGADRTDRRDYASTEVFDSRTNRFARGPAMIHARYKIAGTSMLLRDGNVLVSAGGTAAEILDVGRWAFREVPGRFPAAFRFAATAPLPGGDVMISGGYAAGVTHNDGVWRYRTK